MWRRRKTRRAELWVLLFWFPSSPTSISSLSIFCPPPPPPHPPVPLCPRNPLLLSAQMSLCSVRKRVMAFPAQSFLFQPSVSLALRSSSSPSSSSSSFSSRFIPGCRSVELDRSCSSSSCRSAFAPYFSSAPSSAGFKAQLQLGGEPRSFEVRDGGDGFLLFNLI